MPQIHKRGPRRNQTSVNERFKKREEDFRKSIGSSAITSARHRSEPAISAPKKYLYRASAYADRVYAKADSGITMAEVEARRAIVPEDKHDTGSSLVADTTAEARPIHPEISFDESQYVGQVAIGQSVTPRPDTVAQPEAELAA